MKRVTAKTFSDLHSALEQFVTDRRWIFRGHSDATWKLLPKAGRLPFNRVPDDVVFESWKRKAVEYVQGRALDDWDWLAIAQHHGLATRLLDWTTNPLNAAFFALRQGSGHDAEIIAIMPRYRARPHEDHPFKLKYAVAFAPRAVVPRIVRQGGIFTVHPDPIAALDDQPDQVEDTVRIVIPDSCRQPIFVQLAFYGINSSTLFPDLDGLSEFVNWGVSSGEYFKYL